MSPWRNAVLRSRPKSRRVGKKDAIILMEYQHSIPSSSDSDQNMLGLDERMSRRQSYLMSTRCRRALKGCVRICYVREDDLVGLMIES